MRIDTSKRISQRDLETSLGAFTDPYPYTFLLDQTVEEMLFFLQSRKVERRSEYFYVTNQENTLLGFITLSDVIYASPHALLSEIVDYDVIKLYDDQPLEKGLQLLSSHQLLMLPVVNRENRMVGVLEVTSSESFPQEKKLQSKYLKEDIFQFIGFSIEERKWRSTWTEYRLRMPWLLCNLIGGLICALIGKHYRFTLEAYVVLAFFIPLVLTLSESISVQSMTLSLRFLHLRRIHFRAVLKRSFLEIRASFLLGLTSAALVALFYFTWNDEPRPMFGISISVAITMGISALFGATFPIILRIFKLDPKVAAGPVVLMIVDIMTIALYLSLNTLILTS